MKTVQIVVLDGHSLNPGDLSWKGLEELGTVTLHDRTPAALVLERAANAEVVLTNKTPLGGTDLERLPRLRYIGVLATGYNIVDVAVAAKRGIVVTNVPIYGTDSVAQFVFALLLELCHHTQRHNELARSGAWSRYPDWSYYEGPLVELAGRTLGILGFGRIGRQAAVIGSAFGMHVLASDPFRSDPPPLRSFRWVDPETLLRESDVISLHAPLTPENVGLINSERLSWMKPTAFLINTSRGGLVVEGDLANALNHGQIAGAAVDVLNQEPPSPDNPLLSAKNCIVTPHIAWATKEARSRLMGTAIENVAAFLRGQPVNVIAAAPK
jgi:glycerate dehydrogenase